MNAGEIRRPAIGSMSESANHSIHGAWLALGEAGNAEPLRQGQHDPFVASVEAFLAADPGVSAETRTAVANVIQRNQSLEAEVAKLRTLLQEWIISQQTYKALYYRYSGQSPETPREDLMHEKEQMRRSIRGQLNPGVSPSHLSSEQTRSLSDS